MRFSTKQKKTIEYLKSKEFKEQSDTQHTIKSLPYILKINEYGLITTGTQEGLIISGYNKESKQYYRIEERAQVEGIMKTPMAFKFISMFNEKYDKIAFIRHIDYSKDFLKKIEKGERVSTIPITISGSASTKDGIKELRYDSSIPISLPYEYLSEDFKKISEDVSQVIIIDPKYGRPASSKNGIYHDILSVLKEIQK
jgi:hypothetical protein